MTAGACVRPGPPQKLMQGGDHRNFTLCFNEIERSFTMPHTAFPCSAFKLNRNPFINDLPARHTVAEPLEEHKFAPILTSCERLFRVRCLNPEKPGPCGGHH